MVSENKIDYDAIGSGLTTAAAENQALKTRLLPFVVKATESMTLFQISSYLKGQGVSVDSSTLSAWLTSPEGKSFRLKLLYGSRKRPNFIHKRVNIHWPILKSLKLNPSTQRGNHSHHKNGRNT